jgi:hypothetical protein
MKRPAFLFYPADWLRDTGLRSCSATARGLWIDMICFMHEGYPYGHLKVGDKVILPANLARMCGLTMGETEGCLAELRDAGVFDIDENGVIFSRRMIRDEELRNKRAAGGILGGNPNLIASQRLTSKVKQKPTPSSSSSNIERGEEIEFPANLQTSQFRQAWSEYLDYRKTGRHKPLQPASVKAQLKKLSEMGHDTAIEAINNSIANGWQGIFSPKKNHSQTEARKPVARMI